MAFIKAAYAAYGSTALFVLLWGSAAIFAELGLQHASAFAFLLLRFALASAVLGAIGLRRRRWLPAPGTRLRVAATGALLTGGYTICYLLSLEDGIKPGLLATILGAQPILTLLLTERRYGAARLAGLMLALGGLALIVLRGTGTPTLTTNGIGYALTALACITIGSLLQKRLRQAPIDVLPLQNLVSLALCAGFAAFKPLTIEPGAALVVALVWMGLVISVLAQLLLYRLMSGGNLVNVTSMFYLVPIVTAGMDYVCFGHRLHLMEMVGMGAILAGLALALRPQRPTRALSEPGEACAAHETAATDADSR
ncbi:DMT family transporter [Trinickia fusca]|uniref:DMT family transporter n=1 Tax=Trinickia fusca TaxID=2419777 RepID=A0A494X4G2_9BURK|nr:DMT family transporter [Trinickia fusca]RKP45585.1 DMT family transporter [Trinickia fusca]